MKSVGGGQAQCVVGRSNHHNCKEQKGDSGQGTLWLCPCGVGSVGQVPLQPGLFGGAKHEFLAACDLKPRATILIGASCPDAIAPELGDQIVSVG